MVFFLFFFFHFIYVSFIQVLGLLPTASQAEITSTYRKLSKEYHPDKIKGSEVEKRKAQDRFMEISQAYEILSKQKSTRRQRNKKSTGSSGDTIEL